MGALLFFLLHAPSGFAQEGQRFDLAAQPLASALRAIAAQTGVNILFDLKDVKAFKASALRAVLSPEEAVTRVLAGTGLRVDRTARATFVIRPAPPEAVDAAVTHQSRERPQGALDGVVVTAQKRNEPRQSVAVPVTILDAPELIREGRHHLEDYASLVPGLAVTPNEFNGYPTIAIRGISSGDVTNPTVGATLDDVPIGSSTSIGGGYLAPDLDPSDLSSVEILRGPQGTLYGASSIGGLVKYTSVEPDPTALSGHVGAGFAAVQHGAGAAYDATAGLNAPLGDASALRASFYARAMPGYIDGVGAGQSGVNAVRNYGGHVAALWRGADDSVFKLSAVYQDSEADGSPYVTRTPGLGDLQQDLLPNTGIVHRRFEALIATARARIGPIDVMSVGGYTVSRFVDREDYSAPTGMFTTVLFNTPYAINTDDNTTRRLTEELRLSTTFGRFADWLTGIYYTRESSPYTLQLLAADAGGAPIGTAQMASLSSVYDERAVFTDLTYHITPKFDVQVGARYARILQTYAEVESGPLVDLLQAPQVIPESETRAGAFTYLLAPRLRLTPELMLYGRAASGYRPGGINPAAFPGIPQNFKPDRTDNLELGIKAELLDRRLLIDASIYAINWKGIQLSLTDQTTGENYFTNGGGARSEGVEFAWAFKPLAEVRLGGWFSYDDAVLRQAMPAGSTVSGTVGDRLPYSSRFSANISGEYLIPLSPPFECAIGATLSYVGERLGAFVAAVPGQAPTRQVFPAYVRADIHATLKGSGRWLLDFYANNITDRRGVVGGGIGTQIPTAFQVIQPRTVGLSASWSLPAPH